MAKVCFKIGRGGRFFNGGHKSFFAFDKSITDIAFGYENLNLGEEDGCLYDGRGNVIADKEEWENMEKTGCGCLDIDGEYCSYLVAEVKEMDYDELRLVAKDDGAYIMDIMREFIEDEHGNITLDEEVALKLAKKYKMWKEFVDSLECGYDFVDEYFGYDDSENEDKNCMKINNVYYWRKNEDE